MNRYFHVFLRELQTVLETRSRSIVWFLSSITVPLLMLIFWSGATAAKGGSILNWSYPNFATYYLFIALTSSTVVAHIEEDVAFDDINKGELSNYILKPIPYYGFKFFIELPYRIFQGGLATAGIFIVSIFAKDLITITNSPLELFLAIIILILAFILSFTFKMSIGLLAFWFTEIGGVMNTVEIIFSITAGFIIPLEFFPDNLKLLLNILPFSYMIYYPVVAFLGKLDPMSLVKVILIQLLWIVVLGLIYKFIWKKGRSKFTAVGQ